MRGGAATSDDFQRASAFALKWMRTRLRRVIWGRSVSLDRVYADYVSQARSEGSVFYTRESLLAFLRDDCCFEVLDMNRLPGVTLTDGEAVA